MGSINVRLYLVLKAEVNIDSLSHEVHAKETKVLQPCLHELLVEQVYKTKRTMITITHLQNRNSLELSLSFLMIQAKIQLGYNSCM